MHSGRIRAVRHGTDVLIGHDHEPQHRAPQHVGHPVCAISTGRGEGYSPRPVLMHLAGRVMYRYSRAWQGARTLGGRRARPQVAVGAVPSEQV